MGYAIPAYPHEHAGTAIVLGSAACAPDDLNHARILRPTATIIAVNDAAKYLPVEHVYSLHVEQLEGWARYQLEHFGRRALVHASERVNKRQDRSDFPWVDYWWVGTHCGATSAWAAMRMAKLMGFDEVVLAGCPLIGEGGYCVTPTPNDETKSVGRVDADDPMVQRYRRRMAEYVEEGEGAGVLSMSGWTRELLGAP